MSQEMPALRQTRSTGDNIRHRALFKRISSILVAPTERLRLTQAENIREYFRELLETPVSDEHKKYFNKYFGADVSGKMFTVDEFMQLFQVKFMLGERLLKIFCLDQKIHNGQIQGINIIRVATILWTCPMSIKALILFKLFDENQDELISVDDIERFYNSYFVQFNVFKDENRSKEIVEIFLRGLFDHDDSEFRSSLNFDQFYGILKRNPLLLKSLYVISVPDEDRDGNMPWYQRIYSKVSNNINKFVFMTSYVFIMISLMIYVIIYRINTLQDRSIFPMIARITGMWIQFNYAIVICLMLKQTMSWIRSVKRLRSLIPVDDHIDAHRTVGTVLIFSGLVHTIAYIVYFATSSNQSWAALMFTTASGLGWVAGSAPITGVILVVILSVMFTFSVQPVRQRPGFHTAFRYTHLLYWFIFILLIIHAPHFWKWSIGPMSIFCVEKLYLLKRYISGYGRTRIVSVRLETENILTIFIKRPNHFEFHVGDYVNICLPNLSFNEWHPFSISSGPERPDELCVTILIRKNWTKKAYEHFLSLINERTNRENLSEVLVESSAQMKFPKEIPFTDEDKNGLICLEGPFRTSTSYIFDCEHVVLIGGGIGITPYISALESLIYRLRQQRYICHHCGENNYNTQALSKNKLKKVDIFWINRDMTNINCFRSLFEQFEVEQEAYLNTTPTENSEKRYLDIHLYCTSMRSKDQTMLSILPYDLVSNMYKHIQNADMHTELKTPLRFGRPPWKILFAKFKATYKTTHVFLTGHKSMGDELSKYCNQYSFQFQHEPF